MFVESLWEIGEDGEGAVRGKAGEGGLVKVGVKEEIGEEAVGAHEGERIIRVGDEGGAGADESEEEGGL